MLLHTNKINVQKGWKGEAIEHFETFINLLKEGDPDFPKLADAKKQLATLQSK